MQPFYNQCRMAIINYLIKRDLVKGALLPSQREWCRMTGYSMITVRRAMADLESEGIIKAYPGKGFFLERSFRDERHLAGVILLFDVNILHHLNANLRFLQWELLGRGYELKVINAGEELIPEYFREATNATGVIVRGNLSLEWEKFFQSLSCPVVILGGSHRKPLSGVRTVVSDSRRDVGLAVDFFYRMGRRRFMFLNATSDYAPALSMHKSYVEAMHRTGLGFDERTHFYVSDSERSRTVYDILEKNSDKVDALLIETGMVNDVLGFYFEYDVERPLIGVVADSWHLNRSAGRRLFYFGHEKSVFHTATEVIFDSFNSPENRLYKEDIIVAESKMLD